MLEKLEKKRTGKTPARRKAPGDSRKLIRTFTATPAELSMLESVARYHGFSKSATLTNLLKKEFWRLFPGGTDEVRPDPGARITGEGAT